MSRNIKFRAWYIERAEMFNVLSICFSDLNGRNRTAELNNGYITIYPSLEEIELMQFIGLHDKNGTEIYEGDILSDGEGGIYEVKFEYSSWYLYSAKDRYYSHPLPYYDNNRLQIEGNIYKNE